MRAEVGEGFLVRTASRKAGPAFLFFIAQDRFDAVEVLGLAREATGDFG